MSFTNQSKTSIGVFGNFTVDQLASETFDGLYRGKPIGDYTFDEEITGLTWTNSSKS